MHKISSSTELFFILFKLFFSFLKEFCYTDGSCWCTYISPWVASGIITLFSPPACCLSGLKYMEKVLTLAFTRPINTVSQDDFSGEIC